MRGFIITERVTIIDGDGLRGYFSDIGKIKLLTEGGYTEVVEGMKLAKNEEERKVFEDILVKNSLRFVVSVAKKYLKKGFVLSDIINEGNLGLIEAAKRYDPNSGMKFISYAIWWIRKFIIIYVTESKMIRVPKNKLDDYNEITKFILEYELKNGSRPTIDVLVENGFTEKDYEFFNNFDYDVLDSIDLNVSDSDHSSKISDFIECEDMTLTDSYIEEEETKTKVGDLLSLVDENDRNVIIDLFGLNGSNEMSIFEASKKYGCSEKQIEKIQNKAIKQMRKRSIR